MRASDRGSVGGSGAGPRSALFRLLGLRAPPLNAHEHGGPVVTVAQRSRARMVEARRRRHAKTCVANFQPPGMEDAAATALRSALRYILATLLALLLWQCFLRNAVQQLTGDAAAHAPPMSTAEPPPFDPSDGDWRLSIELTGDQPCASESSIHKLGHAQIVHEIMRVFESLLFVFSCAGSQCTRGSVEVNSPSISMPPSTQASPPSSRSRARRI